MSEWTEADTAIAMMQLVVMMRAVELGEPDFQMYPTFFMHPAIKYLNEKNLPKRDKPQSP